MRALFLRYGLIALALAAASTARAADLDAAAERYRAFIIAAADQALAQTRALGERVAAKDLEGAQKAWIAARIGWERSEVFTSAVVPELDEKIDAWPNARQGFHAIEARLFSAHLTDVERETRALVADLEAYDAEAHRAALTAQAVLNGLARLAYEIGDSKADGGESQFSATSLDDMRNNLIGIRAAYETVFEPTLKAIEATLAARISASVERVAMLLAAPDLKSVDAAGLRAASEDLAVALQAAGPKLGLRRPTLEDLAQ